jgi:agmatine deiminase
MKPLYRMPAEWEPHAATWLAWPHERSDWPGKFELIPWFFAEFIRQLTEVERVHLIVAHERDEKTALRLCGLAGANLKALRIYRADTDRSWLRDTSAIFVRSAKGLTALDWKFNAWAKYKNHKLDDVLPEQQAKWLRLRRDQPLFGDQRVVLEGGSIDVNGNGLLLTTEECLLSKVQERNPGLTRENYEAVFAQYLGVKKVLWLKNGIAGDDTHGHVDDLARFTAKHTVVVASETNRRDPNYEHLRENLLLLRRMSGLRGDKLNVVTLPMPRPIYFDGQLLPASYANFYVANERVFVPTFNDPQDRIALDTLARLFPRRKVVGLPCLDFVLGLGTLHCTTQQQPAV